MTDRPKQPSRRNFLFLTAGAMGTVGAGMAALPLIRAMGPSRTERAAAPLEVDLSPIAPGQAITVFWRGKPIFIRHRTEEEIARARDVDPATLRDPQSDSERVHKDAWLIVIGVCTHFGCIPRGQKPADRKGDYGGWFCSCHGSHFDISGRIRKGPAPKNLSVPDYVFIDEDRIKLG